MEFGQHGAVLLPRNTTLLHQEKEEQHRSYLERARGSGHAKETRVWWLTTRSYLSHPAESISSVRHGNHKVGLLRISLLLIKTDIGVFRSTIMSGFILCSVCAELKAYRVSSMLLECPESAKAKVFQASEHREGSSQGNSARTR